MHQKRIESNKEWEKWGEIDPLQGVASWKGREKDGTNPWTDKDFYQLGQSDWTDFLEQWERYGLDKTSCLEIGCGAGRVTMHLSKYFQTTNAIDVSKGMIDYARGRIKNPSVKFHLSNGIEIPLSDNSVSAVFSTHVFQHFDSLSHATAYFLEISRVLLPEGSLMIHLPVYNWPVMPRIFNILYQFRKHIGNIRAWIWRRLTALGILRPIMRGLCYPIKYFYNTLPNYGFTNIEISCFLVKSNNSMHQFVFARKAIHKND